MPTIERIVQCKSCSGSGVYVGMCERDGAAVVCHVCEGTGKCNYKFEYQEFTGRKKREDVTRVYKQGYGFVIAPAKINFSRNGKIDMEEEGVSYDDFLRDRKSVVQGKSVDLGGRRIIKKKKKH